MVNRTLHLLSSSSLFSSSTWFVPRCRLKAAFQPPTGTPPSGGSAMRTNCGTVVFIRSQPAFPSGQARAQERAFLMTEMLVALAILLGALLPLAYSLVSEKRLARAVYQRAVAMELVDGEMEILAAGEWRAMPAGLHEYQVHAAAVTNLPPGRFLLTVEAPKIRLEWQPAVRNHGPIVVREATIGKSATNLQNEPEHR